MTHFRAVTKPLKDRILLALAAGLASLGALGLGVSGAQADTKRFATHDPASLATIDHSVFASFLEQYLTAGADGINRLRYADVTEDDHQALKAYIADLGTMEITTYNRNEQFAFWANLYNALTVDVILDAYPVKSIRSIRPTLFSIGPWGKERLTVHGESLSLDDIEHRILRPIWKDPRVHYAVNCASIGCPNLRPQPFTGEGLDAALDDAARAFINHPRGARVDDGALKVSKIYRWFRTDFGDGSQKAVIAHLKEFAEPALKAQLDGITSISGYAYDWALNEPA